MADFCDRSPCSRLLSALGRYVFGDAKTGDYKLLVRQVGEEPRAVTFEYCPFCGTRVENLELATTGQIILLTESPKN